MNIGYVLQKKGDKVLHVAPDALLKDAVSIMVDKGIGSLVVFEGHQPISIITERDVLWATNSHCHEYDTLRVSQFMAKSLITCTSRHSVNEAMELMTHNPTQKRIRHLPVVDEGVLVGIVSIGDIVHALLDEVHFENRLLRNYIKNWPEEEV